MFCISSYTRPRIFCLKSYGRFWWVIDKITVYSFSTSSTFPAHDITILLTSIDLEGAFLPRIDLKIHVFKSLKLWN